MRKICQFCHEDDYKCLDVVVRNPSKEATIHVHPAPPVRPMPKILVDVEHEHIPPDAQSAPNEEGIPLISNIPVPLGIPLTTMHESPRVGANNNHVSPVLPGSNGFASNSCCELPIADGEVAYGEARAVCSDEEHPLDKLCEADIEHMRRAYPGRDPLLHEFSDLSHSQGAFAQGREDELTEAPERGDDDRFEIRKGLLFKDLPTLRRLLQEYVMKRKRPFKVSHSYALRRYTVVCEKPDCSCTCHNDNNNSPTPPPPPSASIRGYYREGSIPGRKHF